MKTIILLVALFTVSLTVEAQWTVDYLSQGRVLSSVVGYKDKVYVGGGQLVPSKGIMSNRVDVYNNKTNTWSIDSLSSKRGYVNIIAADDKVFFAGGTYDNKINAKEIDVYDVTSGSWTTDSLLTTQAYGASAVVGNKVLFAGGWSNGGNGVTDIVSVYDVTTGKWSKKNLSQGRAELAAAVVGDVAVFAGGYTNSSTYISSNIVDIYNATDDTWSTATLSQARGGLTAVSANGKVFFAGGLSIVDGSPWELSKVVDIYDVAANSWSKSNLSAGRRYVAAATVGNKVFFAGGEINLNANTATDIVDVYLLDTKSWIKESLSVPHDAFAAAQLPNKAFFIGGGSYKTDKVTKEVEIYTDNSVGINNQKYSSFSIYPNPSSTSMKIEGLNYLQDVEVKIISLTGSTLMRFQSDMENIDISPLDRGVYFLQVLSKDGLVKALKFIKE